MIAERKFSAGNARSFSRASVRSILQIQDAIAERTAAGMHTECHCEAYNDVLTFDRWKGLGFLVVKGERALKIASWVPISQSEKKSSSETQEPAGDTPVNMRLKPHTLCLFCRCQVREKD